MAPDGEVFAALEIEQVRPGARLTLPALPTYLRQPEGDEGIGNGAFRHEGIFRRGLNDRRGRRIAGLGGVRILARRVVAARAREHAGKDLRAIAARERRRLAVP